MLHYLSAKKLFPKDFISIVMYRLAKATTILAYRTTVLAENNFLWLQSSDLIEFRRVNRVLMMA